MKPLTFVIFGGTGDLMQKSVLPAMRMLAKERKLPRTSIIIGVGRRQVSDEEYQAQVFGSEKHEFEGIRVHYVSADASVDLKALKEKILLEEKEEHERIFYCATPHIIFSSIAENIAKQGLEKNAKLVLEKPFGNSLINSKKLDEKLHKHFPEENIYRIDHYLGKDAVQNLMVLRFSNPLFERVWNKDFISSIKIHANETADVSNRIAYYDSAGAVKDMVQNHLLQLASFVLMDAPASLDSADIRRKKSEALRELRVRESSDVVLKQYEGYKKEAETIGVKESRTPTYAKIKLYSKSRRWKGVPIIIQTGKALSDKSAAIEISFHKEPCILHCNVNTSANRIVIEIQPTQDIKMFFSSMDNKGEIQNTSMIFSTKTEGATSITAYKKLIEDIFLSEKTLFVHSEEVKQAWKLTDKIIKILRDNVIHEYKRGITGL